MWAMKCQVYISVSRQRLITGLFFRARFTETLMKKITSGVPFRVPLTALPGVLMLHLGWDYSTR